MTDLARYREGAEMALRIACDSNDRWLIKTLQAFAAECNANADAMEAEALGEDRPEDERARSRQTDPPRPA
jgi:hypothetical protein